MLDGSSKQEISKGLKKESLRKHNQNISLSVDFIKHLQNQLKSVSSNNSFCWLKFEGYVR